MATSPLSRAPASSANQRGPTATSASMTQTVTIRPSSTRPQPVLRLRGAMRSPGERSERRIQWAEDVIDNEGLGRKSSKVCCIYHPPKASLDDSSDSSSDSSSSDSDSGDDGSARPAGGKRRAGGLPHEHSHDNGQGDGCNHGSTGPKKSKRSRSPNAYEKMPKPKEGGPKKA